MLSTNRAERSNRQPYIAQDQAGDASSANKPNPGYAAAAGGLGSLLVVAITLSWHSRSLGPPGDTWVWTATASISKGSATNFKAVTVRKQPAKPSVARPARPSHAHSRAQQSKSETMNSHSSFSYVEGFVTKSTQSSGCSKNPTSSYHSSNRTKDRVHIAASSEHSSSSTKQPGYTASSTSGAIDQHQKKCRI
ncbi:hypothetical protein Nepgr_006773 [Nepenthes gracilis]|uniref:Uncharacterized protein n=1 Tax=Nepenthes gracilis TaxID=150966 RepID=A0AAD3XHN9_NEPGR|nr:hypothetical protein Nepgr_006773 [Nepenthes gracilis]